MGGNLFFWIGIGAAQKGTNSKEIKRRGRWRRIISIIVGILLALLIAAGLLTLFLVSYR